AVALAIGAAGVAWGLLRGPSPTARPVTRWIAAQKNFSGYVNLSHDGSRVAYTEGLPVDAHICVRMLDQFEGKPVPGGEKGYFPVFSPDGHWILYSTPPNKLKKIPVNGGAPIALCDGNTSLGAAWGD